MDGSGCIYTSGQRDLDTDLDKTVSLLRMMLGPQFNSDMLEALFVCINHIYVVFAEPNIIRNNGVQAKLHEAVMLAICVMDTKYYVYAAQMSAEAALFYKEDSAPLFDEYNKLMERARNLGHPRQEHFQGRLEIVGRTRENFLTHLDQAHSMLTLDAPEPYPAVNADLGVGTGVGVPQEYIDSLATFKASEVFTGKELETAQCVLCEFKYFKDDLIPRMKGCECNAAHLDCLRDHLEKNNKCPLCNRHA